MRLVPDMPYQDPPTDDRPDPQTLPPSGTQMRTVATSLRVVMRQCLAVLGLLLIVLAIPVGILTPFLPIGLPVAILGVVLLGRNALWGKRWMEGVLVRFPKLERFAPGWLMRAVFGREKTRR